MFKWSPAKQKRFKLKKKEVKQENTEDLNGNVEEKKLKEEDQIVEIKILGSTKYQISRPASAVRYKVPSFAFESGGQHLGWGSYSDAGEIKNKSRENRVMSASSNEKMSDHLNMRELIVRKVFNFEDKKLFSKKSIHFSPSVDEFSIAIKSNVQVQMSKLQNINPTSSKYQKIPKVRSPDPSIVEIRKRFNRLINMNYLSQDIGYLGSAHLLCATTLGMN